MSVLSINSEDTTNKKEAKITLIGDPHTGKASLLLSYMSGKFFEGFGIWDPFTTYTKEKEIDGEQYKLSLCTMLGQQDYNSLRPLGYPKTTCFLLCYSINKRETCKSIKEKWVPEIKRYMPDTPFILVG
ncbi:rho family gtpase [Holotrichia oblita]|uniref:Rho family gtpase n=1 Tax=Holotrichia oblita TaxID=644536 RepID=A0ACB9T0D9_HOLOL|nr:rho family gtpase [Holotrichia oblita]